MTIRKLLDYDPVNGIKTFFRYDPLESKHAEERSWTFEYEAEDFAHEVEASKALQNDDDHWKDGVKDGMVHFAHIPNAILLKWHTMGVNINDAKELINMTNRPEWKYLKCVDKVHIAK